MATSPIFTGYIMAVKYIDQGGNVAVLTKAGAKVTSTSYMPENDITNTNFNVSSDFAIPVRIQDYATKGLGRVAPWGSNNLKPNYYLELLSESNIMAQLIHTAVSFAIGHLYTFKWEIDIYTRELMKTYYPAPPEVQKVLSSRKILKLMRSRATDFYIHGNTWCKIILSRDAKNVADLQHVDAFQCRLELKDPKSKRIENHFVCSDWRSPRWQPNESMEENISGINVRKYPAFDEYNPLAYMQSLHHSKLYWSGHEYYGIQPWHSAHNWIRYANTMPVWMVSNIEKSFNIKYHIEYPDGFFSYLEELFDSPEERQNEKTRIFQVLDDMLSGAENAQSTFYTPYSLDEMTGKEYAGWKIKSIPNDLKDDAFIKAFEVSNDAMTSAMGIDPSLAGIQRAGKMPASGSEKRISYQLHEVLRTEEARKIMVEPLEIWRDVNGYDSEMQFGFLQRNIVTLAEDPSGMNAEMISTVSE